MDFSHKVNFLQVGKSVSRLNRLSRKFKDIIDPTSLTGEEFNASNNREGHSRFLYEMNIVTAKIGYQIEYFYNYTKNTVTSVSTSPNLSFRLDFSALSVEYIEGSENFLEFLTYLFGIIGGIVSLIHFITNLIQGWCFKRKTYEQIPQ
jgi:hypothetical protein